MKKTELYKIEGTKILVRTFSDTGHKIIQTDTGEIFDDAVDEGYLENGEYFPLQHNYEETEELINNQEDNGESDDSLFL